MPRPTYPTPPTADQVDDYHGTLIADPYRPLEDSDAPASREWISAENELTEAVLGSVPARPEIRERLAALWDYPRAGAPWRRGSRWFQLRNSGLQNQDVLWTADGPDSDGTVLIDPNSLSEQGTTALSAIAVSESGELVASATSDAGSDWRTWGVRRTATGQELPDRVAWSKFASAAWTHDDAGFFYGRYPEPSADAAYDAPNRDMELRYHLLGGDQADDRLVFATPHEPEWGFEPEVSDDGRLLAVIVWRGTDPDNRIYVADLSDGVAAASVRPLLDAADASYEPIAAVGRTLYLLTDRDAPFGRVIAIDLDDPDHPREVIVEGPDTLERVRLVGGRLACVYLHHAHHRLALFELDGRSVMDVAMPGIGTVVDLAGRREDEELFLTWMTFTAPPTVLAVRIADGTVREVRRPALAWDPDDFVSEQVFVASDDGTRVPMFLIHRRDVAPRWRHPDAALRLRGLPDLDRADVQARMARLDGARRTARRGLACVAEASTGKRGTTTGAWPTSSTSSMTSLHARDGLPRRAGPGRGASASREVRTVVCWSGPASRSIRSCSGRRSPKSA